MAGCNNNRHRKRTAFYNALLTLPRPRCYLHFLDLRGLRNFSPLPDCWSTMPPVSGAPLRFAFSTTTVPLSHTVALLPWTRTSK